MQAKEIEYEVAMSMYRRQQKEVEDMLYRILGKYGEPKRSLKEVREELSKQLKGVSVSRMVIEER